MSTYNKTPKTLFDGTRFQFWLSTRFFTNFGRNMQALIVSWQVYQISKSPLALGIIGLSEAIPFFAVALWAGHMADVRERRGILAAAQWAQAVSAVGLFVISTFGEPRLPFIFLFVGISGIAISFEVAAAGSYVQTLIPKELFPKAAAWNLTFFNAATIVGPVLAGWIIALKSAAVSYFVTTIFFACSALACLFLPKIVPTQVHHEAEDSGLKRIVTGFKFIRAESLVFASMSLDMVAVLFGGAVALYPIFADILHVGPVGLGMLRSAPALGSFLVALATTQRELFKSNWRNMCRAVIVYGVTTIVFAVSKNFVFTLFLLTVNGMSDAVSVITRSSLLQARTPDHLRGRVVSVGSMFIRSSNEIGGFESGVAAKLMGTVPSVIFGGVMTLLSIPLVGVFFPDLRQVSSNREEH